MHTEERIHALLHKYYFSELDPSEQVELNDILAAADDEQVVNIMTKVFKDHPSPNEIDISDQMLTERINQILATDKIKTQPAQPTPSYLRKYRFTVAAAVALIVSAIGLLYFVNKEPSLQENLTAASPQDGDFQPGKEGAILTLSDGTQVVLDSLGNSRETITIDGVSLQIKDGQLTYADADAAQTKTIYNTMTTPKGRQFQLVLSDGTKVWLNAASSITYPVAFVANGTREVSISGEAYFEVTRSKDKPFVVSITNQPTKVQVLGTKFNVNAYGDHADIQTTLLAGKVVVEHHNAQKTLVPGQQASTYATANNIDIATNIDPAHIIAWKDDIFSFKDVRLDAIMKELARWYDIEVKFQGKIPPQKYSGKIGKNLTLQQVLSLLGATNIKYTVEGDRTIIINN